MTGGDGAGSPSCPFRIPVDRRHRDPSPSVRASPRGHWHFFSLFYSTPPRHLPWDLKAYQLFSLNSTLPRFLTRALREAGWQDAIDPAPLSLLDFPDSSLFQTWWYQWMVSHLWPHVEPLIPTELDLSAVSLNICPVGFWGSIPAIREIASHCPGIIFLQDLRYSRRSKRSVKSAFSSLFQQYHTVISHHAERTTKPDGGGKVT
jgi:hypothetical protein